MAQVEKQFLPQVVGEVFEGATELVKENVFSERILRYAPGAIANASAYYLRQVQFIACEDLPIDEQLITINETIWLPVVDQLTSLSKEVVYST